MLPIVRLSHEEFDDYVRQIQESNLSKFTQNGLVDLLRTAVQQTDEATSVGWL